MKLALALLEKKSEQFRNDLKLESTKYVPLKETLARLNVLTVFSPLDSDFSGMAIKAKSRLGNPVYMILINSRHSIGKQNLTICHELYHLFIQEKFKYHVCYTGRFSSQKDPEEFNADVFGSFFLLPEPGIYSIIPDNELKQTNGITLRTIIEIEQYYKCSRAALLYRLRKLQIIDQHGYDRFSSHVSREAGKLGFDVSLYADRLNKKEVWGDYESLAETLFNDGKISESFYNSLLLDIGKEISDF